MEEKILQLLKSLKILQPEKGFLERSKNLIISAPQKQFPGLVRGVLDSLKLSMALSLASLLLFVVIGGFSYLNLQKVSPGAVSLINEAKLRSEASNLDFQIQLGEVKYYLESDEAIGAEIDKLLDELTL
ncbi:MAG: hypothetical protein G01um10143_48 [Parcubacteria group bacterium Gr01-1014_3]|nr:MAG: hypothetical protein G01um10143_48 [Parcubacteria group bacterium Gr01-1014_3]